MLRNIHPRCIKSPSSNHFPFSQELDESGHKPFTSGRWDQFKANEELFGYVSTYKAGKPVVGNDVKNQGCWVNLGNWLEADVFETHGFHACVGYFCLGRFWKIQYSITLLVFFYKNPYNICCAFSFLTLFNTSSEVNPISFWCVICRFSTHFFRPGWFVPIFHQDRYDQSPGGSQEEGRSCGAWDWATPKSWRRPGGSKTQNGGIPEDGLIAWKFDIHTVFTTYFPESNRIIQKKSYPVSTMHKIIHMIHQDFIYLWYKKLICTY